MPSLVLVTPPAVEPVTLAQAKAHLRVDFDDDNPYISALITAARLQCEVWTCRSFITTHWKFGFDSFPWGAWGPVFGQHYTHARAVIQLPRAPCQSVESITYLDPSGVQQTYSGFLLDVTSEPARITPPWMGFYPICRPQIGSVQISFTAGYGDLPSNVPMTIQQAILGLVATYYENRESISELALKPVPQFVEYLLAASSYGSYTI